MLTLRFPVTAGGSLLTVLLPQVVLGHSSYFKPLLPPFIKMASASVPSSKVAFLVFQASHTKNDMIVSPKQDLAEDARGCYLYSC